MEHEKRHRIYIPNGTKLPTPIKKEVIGLESKPKVSVPTKPTVPQTQPKTTGSETASKLLSALITDLRWSELLRKTGIKPFTALPVLKKLEKEGKVKKVIDKDGKKRWHKN